MQHSAGAMQTQMMNSLLPFDDIKSLIEFLAIAEHLLEIRTPIDLYI